MDVCLSQMCYVILCRLYEKLSEHDQAAAAYTEYINEMSCNDVSCRLTHGRK